MNPVLKISNLSSHRQQPEEKEKQEIPSSKPLSEIINPERTPRHWKIGSTRSTSSLKNPSANLLLPRSEKNQDHQNFSLEPVREWDQHANESTILTTNSNHDLPHLPEDDSHTGRGTELPQIPGGEPLTGVNSPSSQEVHITPILRPLGKKKSTNRPKNKLSVSAHVRLPKFFSTKKKAKEEKPKATGKLYQSPKEIKKYSEITHKNSLAAFGMDMYGTINSLEQSAIYEDACPENVELLGFTKRSLELHLREMIRESAAQITIRTYNLTPAEAVAVRFYGRQGFTNVQPALRKKQDPSLGKDIPLAPAEIFTNLVNTIASCFGKLPPLLLEDTMLFRGSHYFDFDNSEITEYQDPAFVSTSMIKNVVQEKFPGGFLLMFKASPTSPCRDISTLTGNPLEAEVLFLPGTTFRILSRNEAADSTIEITLEPTSAPSPWTLGL